MIATLLQRLIMSCHTCTSFNDSLQADTAMLCLTSHVPMLLCVSLRLHSCHHGYGEDELTIAGSLLRRSQPDFLPHLIVLPAEAACPCGPSGALEASSSRCLALR